MKKVVFKGTINGKEFDNVQDYNNEMTKLISEGSSVEAHSQTNIVNDEEDEKKALEKRVIEDKKPSQSKQCHLNFDIDDYTPFFTDGDECYYLDRFVSSDKDLNDKNLKDLKSILNECTDSLKRKLNSGCVSIDKLFELINIIKSIKDEVMRDMKNNDSAIIDLNSTIDDLKYTIESATNEIHDMEDKIQVLNNAKPVLDMVNKYYSDTFDIIKKHLLSFS